MCHLKIIIKIWNINIADTFQTISDTKCSNEVNHVFLRYDDSLVSMFKTVSCKHLTFRFQRIHYNIITRGCFLFISNNDRIMHPQSLTKFFPIIFFVMYWTTTYHSYYETVTIKHSLKSFFTLEAMKWTSIVFKNYSRLLLFLFILYLSIHFLLSAVCCRCFY